MALWAYSLSFSHPTTKEEMVFAKTSKAAARLSEQVREKIFKKEYLAIVDGKPKKDKGTLEDYLLKNEKTNTSKVVKEETKILNMQN